MVVENKHEAEHSYESRELKSKWFYTTMVEEYLYPSNSQIIKHVCVDQSSLQKKHRDGGILKLTNFVGILFYHSFLKKLWFP